VLIDEDTIPKLGVFATNQKLRNFKHNVKQHYEDSMIHQLIASHFVRPKARQSLRAGRSRATQHRVLVRADHFSYPTAAGNAAPRRPQTAPVTQWYSLAAGMRCRGGARVAGSCHCHEAIACRSAEKRSAYQRVQAHKKCRRCE
jgi:hypothetical protein